MSKSAINFRTTWILIGVSAVLLGVLALFVFFGDDSAPNKDGFLLEAFHSLSVKPDEITRLEIDKGAEKLVFEKREGRWRMTAPIEARADNERVEAIVRELLMARREEKGADISSKLADHGLDNPPVKITLVRGDRPATLSLGKATIGGDSAVVYVLTSDQPKKAQATRLRGLRALLKDKPAEDGAVAGMMADVNDFRTRKLLGEGIPIEAATSQILRVRLTEKLAKGERIVELSRANPERLWRFEIPPGYGDVLTEVPPEQRNPSMIYNLSSLLNNLLAIEVFDVKDYLTGDRDLKSLGLDPSNDGVIRVDLQRQTGPTETLWISPVNAKKERDKVYVLFEGDKAVAQVNAERPRMLQTFLDDPNVLRERTLLKLKPDRVDALDVTMGGKTFELRRTAGNWRVVQGAKQYIANKGAIEELVVKLNEQRLVRGFPADGLDDKALGLEPPVVEIKLWEDGIVAGKEPAPLRPIPSARLLFGATDKDDLVNVRRYVGLAPSTMKIPAEVLSLARRGLLDYVDIALTPFDPERVEKLTFLRGGETWVIERVKSNLPVADARWTILAPASMKGKSGNGPEIARILFSYRNMKSEHVVAEKATPEELKSYGLDPAKPDFKLSLKLQDDPIERTYFLGNSLKGKLSAYTKTSMSDFVFESPLGRIELVTKGKLLDPILYRIETGALTMKLTGWYDPKTEKSQTIEFDRKEGGIWSAKDGRRFDYLLVEAFLLTVANPQTIDQVVEKSGPKPEQGLDLKSGALDIEITIGKDAPITLKLGGLVDKNGKQIFVTTNQAPGDVFTMDGERLLPFKESPDAFGK